MSFKEADGRKTWAAKEKITSAALNAWGDGDQTEMEERMEAHTLNGVESGSALSISGTDIVIAAGVMWCEGKRYEPAASTIAFSGSDGSGTYYLYVDPSNDTTPYQKQVGDPGDGYLVLGTVVWNGADTLSALDDIKRTGIVYHEEPVHISGALSDGSVGHAVYAGADGRSFWVQGIKGMLGDNGSGNGPTYLSAYQGVGGSEAALHTTGTRRLWFAHGDTDRLVKEGGEPEQNRTMAPGNVLRIRVDGMGAGIGVGATDAWVCAYGRLV
jgi:hypothetical protein